MALFRQHESQIVCIHMARFLNMQLRPWEDTGEACSFGQGSSGQCHSSGQACLSGPACSSGQSSSVQGNWWKDQQEWWKQDHQETLDSNKKWETEWKPQWGYIGIRVGEATHPGPSCAAHMPGGRLEEAVRKK